MSLGPERSNMRQQHVVTLGRRLRMHEPFLFLSFLNNASREDARIIVLLKTSSDRQLAWQYTNETSAITGITSCVVQSRSLAVHNECPTLRCARPW